MLDLQPAAREVIRLLDGVRDDQLSDPTPNRGTSVGALLDHFMSLTAAFTAAARKTSGGGSPPPAPSADNLPADWRRRLIGRLRALAEAWQDPAAWDGTTQAGGVTSAADEIGLVALDELVLHGWDLAKATGQPFTVTPASEAAVLGFTEATAEPGAEAMREGLFGPVVAVPPGAPPFDRALGFAGRDPAWSPRSVDREARSDKTS
ncbi:MAG TPA: TIGR03086 family metal-binding protein [Asanoa sp.]